MNSDNVDHARVYYEAVSGRDRRGRVFGLGSDELKSHPFSVHFSDLFLSKKD